VGAQNYVSCQDQHGWTTRRIASRGKEPGSERSGWTGLRITRGRVGRVVFPPEHVAEVKAIACEHGRHVPGSSRTTRTSRPRPAGRWTSTPTCATANGRARTSTNTNRASAAAHVTRVQVSSERRDSWLRAAGRLRLKPSARLVSIARAEPYGRPCRAVDGYGTPSSTRAGAHTDVRGPEVGAPGAMGAPASCQVRPRATAPR
jgi:hypothetical protein